MSAPLRLIAICLVFFTSGCAGEKQCAPPKAHWHTPTPTPAPGNIDTIVVDEHDRIVWNGTITSLERLRDTLNQADASAHTVQLSPTSGASCEMIETVRLAMERSLSCGAGRCVEVTRTQ